MEDFFFGSTKSFLMNIKEIIFLFNGYRQTFFKSFFIFVRDLVFLGFKMKKYLIDFYYNLI